MSQWFYVSVVAAALAVAGTYIFWGPSNRPKKKKKDAIPGMLNLGNSCFLNAVLQALASCPSCVNWLKNAVEYANEFNSEECILIKSILTAVNSLNTNEEYCTGAEVIKALRMHRWIISHEEHDAHELFHVLTTTVEEELLAVKPVVSLLDTKKLNVDDTANLSKLRKPIMSSVKSLPLRVAFPMRGLLVNELKCNNCNYKYPARYDTFDSISLVIPTPNTGKLSLHHLLLKFVSCELIQDVVCEACNAKDESDDKDKVKTTFTQQVSFGKLPECLCFHIQRTVWQKYGLPSKCYDSVSFPEHLAMDHFVHCQAQGSAARLRLTGGNASAAASFSNEQISSEMSCPPLGEAPQLSAELNSAFKSIPRSAHGDESLGTFKHVYLLKAVIVHLGDTSSGHFVTYRRVASEGSAEKWFYTSDLEVKEVPFSDVAKASAYMLFYEKV